MLGLDVSGTVEKAPENSTFSPGDRVVAFPKNGSYAEYVVANENLVFKIPDALSMEQAAAMPTVSFLSYILIFEIGQVKPTDTIIVHSAAGGVGSILIQLAKIANVSKIIGTVGSLEKESYVLGLGADFVYTYDTFSKEVLKLTNNIGANVIFDSCAGNITSKSLECLAYYGNLVQFGNSTGKTGNMSTSDVHSSCRTISGFSLGTTRKFHPERLRAIADNVIELFSSGKVSLPVAQVFDLKDARLAHALIESRNYKGKILIKM
ncbi:quinone oxidoreductase family protein [Bacillus mesophilum]|nr:zinc-binding dehydrogenase [Bacillus mesophilum]